jgi:ubiquinone/menaquinone biosynthesis C-methylase UbiE
MVSATSATEYRRQDKVLMSAKSTPAPSPVPDYGVDAPAIRRGMLIAGLVGSGVAVAALLARRGGVLPDTVLLSIAALGLIASAYGCFMSGYMSYSSWYGKLQTRDRLLDLVGARRPWTGDEAVLDVGCGRGLMLLGAARRLTSGRAVGIDLWRQEDQANNSPQAALENAKLEGVADRVRIDTGDARALPYAAGSFDVVVSHWVVHNLPQDSDRRKALDEMIRVLRPGGVLVVADIEHVPTYCEYLRAVGAIDLQFLDGGLEAKVMAALSGGTYCPQALLARRS